jgi:hypothetical protein
MVEVTHGGAERGGQALGRTLAAASLRYPATQSLANLEVTLTSSAPGDWLATSKIAPPT